MLMKLERMGSRKFLVTLSALLGAYMAGEIELSRLAIMGLVAIVYVIIEGMIDKTRAEQVADDVGKGIEMARGEQSES